MIPSLMSNEEGLFQKCRAKFVHERVTELKERIPKSQEKKLKMLEVVLEEVMGVQTVSALD